jgi:hypothetical protein
MGSSFLISISFAFRVVLDFLFDFFAFLIILTFSAMVFLLDLALMARLISFSFVFRPPNFG